MSSILARRLILAAALLAAGHLLLLRCAVYGLVTAP